MTSYLQEHQPIYYILVVLSSISITLLSIPSIIFIARERRLYDDLGHLRKLHKADVPRLGGVAIFVSFTITLLFWNITGPALPLNYLLTACIMLFAIGIKDDLAGVNPRTKFIIQFIAGLTLSVAGNIRLSNLYGLFGIYELSYFPSMLLSILIIIFIINAFNLIDGIDGLAATTGIIVNSVFSALLISMHQYQLAAISLSLAGAILGFIKFNISPAKIFMGDTGSLLTGLVSAVVALKFLEAAHSSGGLFSWGPSALGICMAILIGPLSDTLRIFVVRLSKGRSPFVGDRNHIHHRILKLGFSHLQTTLILAGLNGSVILLAFFLADYGNGIIILSIALLLMLFNWILTYFIRSKDRESYALRNLFV
ncbi:UDP-N-acetylmuramyl pentapeptide phosphotransferase/UDP-N-acetylglucosamine-1-phosphate transferase [Pedobacter sp. AK017]|uniref:MraY family glycosyltransferase n=1 Tax=Pedobacter sp. AK017 TaxID=2723073 RepID=UPI00161E29E1|nr:MraY family glycosyltransferase [Pedobacter sp. AK017]MBB5438885.1 UDP-N-acetylmuramyl pentapeptide phosphotransferase/UDP-N-acetylglucosamine-1-phosphate transferase [Pedobacter sp. AK017]